jgi:hypothetical protein
MQVVAVVIAVSTHLVVGIVLHREPCFVGDLQPEEGQVSGCGLTAAAAMTTRLRQRLIGAVARRTLILPSPISLVPVPVILYLLLPYILTPLQAFGATVTFGPMQSSVLRGIW